MSAKKAKAKPRTREEQYERRQALARAVKSGRSVDDVAAEFGVTGATVRMACHQFRVKLPATTTRGRPAGSRSRHFEIVAALLRGEREIDVAERMGVTKQAVHLVKQRAAEAGVFDGLKRSQQAEVEALREKERLERQIDERRAAREASLRETEARYERIVSLINSGKSVEDTAAAVGMNPFYVYRVLEKYGVEAYSPNRLDDDTRFKIVRDLLRDRTDQSLADIAKRHGVSPNTVIRIRDTAAKVGLFKEAKKYDG